MKIDFNGISRKRKIALTIISIVYVYILGYVYGSFSEIIATTLGFLTAIIVSFLWIK